MDPSGIIFVVLAFAWAVYLVPKAVRHQEDVARTRSVDRFSSAMRVLARNEPEGDADTRLVTPSRPDESARPSGSTPDPERPAVQARRAPRPNLAARRAAARAAARRRRRVTLLLVAATLVVVALAASTLVPWWTVAVPGSLTVLFLILCRRQVRRENEASWAARKTGPAATTPPRRAVRVDSAYGSAAVDVQPHDDSHTRDDTVKVPVPEPETVPVAVETADGGSLWDPLPVTLPTYVNKARASRTVRTIDLGAPGSWTSGRDEADSALVDEAGACEPGEDATLGEPRRAVGS